MHVVNNNRQQPSANNFKIVITARMSSHQIMHRPCVKMMHTLLLIVMALTAISPIHASQTTATSQKINHQLNIHYSHAFHYSEPRALVHSVLSDVRRKQLPDAKDGNNSEETLVFDVDVSSSRLGDDALVALVEGLLALVESKVDEASYGTAKSAINNGDNDHDKRGRRQMNKNRQFSLKLALGMNKLTPLGASKLFDMLVSGNAKDGKSDADEAVNKTTTLIAEGKNGENQTKDDLEVKSDSLETVQDSGELSANKTDGLNNNGTTIDKLIPATTSETNQDETDMSADESLSNFKPDIVIEELDLSFNDFSGHGIQLLNSARRLFEGGTFKLQNNGVGMQLVPRVLILENCGIGPAFCRSIGRGILNSVESKTPVSRPSVLHLGGNHDIGDAGTVALAAAFRLANPSSPDSGSDTNEVDHNANHRVIEELDLSSCSVGDAGAEALSLALAFNPGCVARLDLSNNKVTDAGAKAIGRGLVEASRIRYSRGDKSPLVLDRLVLDNNVGVGDEGASALAEALACGAVESISLRSCSVRADGAAAFGKVLISASKHHSNKQSVLNIDLSGNHFGTLKPKKKKGAKYSASLIKDKARTNISFIGKSIHSRLKGAGVSMGITAESDDDEEDFNVMGGLLDAEDDAGSEKMLETNAICGARSFAGEILNCNDGDGASVPEKNKSRFDSNSALKVSIGMRQCCLDPGAIDALSASIIGARKTGVDLALDVSMNAGVEATTQDALLGAMKGAKLLSSMANRHTEALEVIHQARRRAALASEAAAARAHAEMELGGAIYHDDEEYPADSDYDNYDDDFDAY